MGELLPISISAYCVRGNKRVVDFLVKGGKFVLTFGIKYAKLEIVQDKLSAVMAVYDEENEFSSFKEVFESILPEGWTYEQFLVVMKNYRKGYKQADCDCIGFKFRNNCRDF